MAFTDGVICQHCGRSAIKEIEFDHEAYLRLAVGPPRILGIPVRLDASMDPAVIRMENERGEVVSAIKVDRPKVEA